MNPALAPIGFLAYRGPSMLNGAAIALIVLTASKNTKTGNDVAQSYILADGDERPTEAMRSGADEAICGDCKHRFLNARTCYVVVRQAATGVWDAMRRGNYPDLSAYPDIVGDILRDRMLRIGTYGDPAAVPVAIWRELTLHVEGFVGYTHQWRTAGAQALRELCMASVDSVAEMDVARAMGWRTFRVRTHAEPLQARESICPASEEGGHKLRCETCRACNGAHGERHGSIAIIVHGNHQAFRESRLVNARVAAEALA